MLQIKGERAKKFFPKSLDRCCKLHLVKDLLGIPSSRPAAAKEKSPKQKRLSDLNPWTVLQKL